MKKKLIPAIFLVAAGCNLLSSGTASASVTAPCSSTCPTCEAGINAFQNQAQQTLAVAAPPNPQTEVSTNSCLGTALNFNLNNFLSGFSLSSILKQLEQAACSATSTAITQAVANGNSLMNFNLPAGTFTQLTGMSSFTPLQINYNSGSNSAPTFSNTSSSIWPNVANSATGQATNQVSGWYNNILP